MPHPPVGGVSRRNPAYPPDYSVNRKTVTGPNETNSPDLGASGLGARVSHCSNSPTHGVSATFTTTLQPRPPCQMWEPGFRLAQSPGHPGSQCRVPLQPKQPAQALRSTQRPHWGWGWEQGQRDPHSAIVGWRAPKEGEGPPHSGCSLTLAKQLILERP